MVRDMQFLKFLRVFSMIEGVSTLILFFIAMPLKYYFELPLAVSVVGSLHGVLFLGLVVTLVVGIEKIPLPLSLFLMGVGGAVIPFGPFIVDKKLKKLGEA